MVTIFDLKSLNLPTGTYEVSVRAKGNYWVDSEGSTLVTFIVEPPKQLTAPTISIEGNELRIRDDEGIITHLSILVDGEVKAETSKTGAFTVIFDLITLGLSAGNYVITVIGEAEGYLPSEASNAITYSVLHTLETPTTSLDGDILNIYDYEGLATSFDIIVDGEVKTNIVREE
jgi:hypothetical protein